MLRHVSDGEAGFKGLARRQIMRPIGVAGDHVLVAAVGIDPE